VTTGRELGRRDMGDGFTDVTVALGADRQGHLIVPTDLVDGPGYQDMLDAHATKHSGLVAFRDEGTPL
jgi:hypothetical protein